MSGFLHAHGLWISLYIELLDPTSTSYNCTRLSRFDCMIAATEEFVIMMRSCGTVKLR